MPFSVPSAGADDRRSIENPLRLVKLAVAARRSLADLEAQRFGHAP